MYQYRGKIKSEFIDKAKRCLEQYENEKHTLVERIKDNLSVYRQEYAQLYDKNKNSTEPKSAFILSAVENKQADFSDNFPIPNLLAREPSDEETAKLLTQIIPTILDNTEFKKVYKEHSRQKIKKGTGIYGVFYNQAKEDIEICELDILNVFCDMHVKDIQDSEFFFIIEYVSNSLLKEKYPHAAELFDGDTQKQGYLGTNQTVTLPHKSRIVDCYYKKNDGSVHLMKMCKGNVIEATEDLAGYEDGLYKHGKYPVVFDSFYPDDDSPFGFGIIDVAKHQQGYIDRLDGAILKNCFRAGIPKVIVSDDSGINPDDFADDSKEIIEAHNLNENTYRVVDKKALPAEVINHRNSKIVELKEFVGNRDFQQGGTANGVTSGSAIQVLQEAGDKLSRSQIDDTYQAYKEVVAMCIELVREFYTEEKVYRITNELGGKEYKIFSNEMLVSQEEVRDPLGFILETKPKKVEFDISIVPQRQNVYKRETNNQTITQLWQMGFFNPQNVDISILALKAMNFDGRDSLIQSLTELKEQQTKQLQAVQMMQMQQGQQIM